MISEAFSRLGLPLVIVGEGPENKRIIQNGGANVHLIGWQSEDRLRMLMGKAKALVHAAEEDFGIALVEAQAAGCPAITFGKGGALETIINGQTGILYP